MSRFPTPSTAESSLPIKMGHFKIRGANNPPFDVYSGFEMIIGRNPDKCYPCFDDYHISNLHLALYSIVHDKRGNSDVQPLLYAEDLSSNGTYWNGTLIGKGNGGFLISGGDEVRISPTISLIFHAEEPHECEGADSVQTAEIRCFKDTYDISKRRLGYGVHGQVHMAVHLSLGYQLACKIVDLRKVGQEEKERVESSYTFKNAMAKHGAGPQTIRAMANASVEAVKRRVTEFSDKRFREINILKEMSHPNIIRLEKVYHTDSTLYIFEELITGGDLFSFIEYKGGSVDEACTAVIVRQVLEALDYIHTQDVVHRDIKPENILISSLADATRVVLTDFGSAIKVTPTSAKKEKVKRIQSRDVGTMEYVAPEIGGLNPTVRVKGYTKAVDLWSLGCVTATLLTGATPFSSFRKPADRRTSYEVIMEAAVKCDLNNLNMSKQWRLASREAKDFVERLLVLDETARMTAREGLCHKWYEDWRKDFDEVYSFSLKNYKPRMQMPNVVEKIDPQDAVNKARKEVSRVRKTRIRTCKPIEAHYRPLHRNIDQLLAPPRVRPTLPPIAEEPSKPLDTRKESGSSKEVRTSQNTTEENEMPAVENLQIAASNSSPQGGSSIVETGSGQHSNGTEKTSQVEFTVGSADSIMTDESASLEDGVMESPPRVLAENSSKANQSTMSDEPFSMDLCNVPETPSKSRLKKPSASIRASTVPSPIFRRTPPRKRKRGSVFDFENDDEEENETQQENTVHDNAHMYSISFTPINRRQPMQLGDLEATRLNTVLPPLEDLFPSTREGATIFGHHRPLGKGHDGPLKSKLSSLISSKGDSQASSKRTGVDGKYPFHTTSTTMPQDSSLPLPAESLSLAPKTPCAQRRPTAFDWDEHELFTEASTVNSSFRSARTLALSIERRRAEKTADLSDSIRTAHE
ncbi:hypothetical protein MMC30_004513 [Trapelia coarctata]|nr:hypothetical protein [Trapelia coarctata]